MKNTKTNMMITCALFAALMCICGPLSVPIGPVPVSLTNLVIYFAVMILGTYASTVSYVIYLLLGLVGLPVFSGFQGGLSKLAGPTGGYLVGFVLMAIICGLFMEKSKNHIVITILGMILGTAVAYLFGTIWFVLMMDCDIAYALTICVFPFIPFDLIKIVVAVIVGKQIRKRLLKAQVIK